jgi:hypothetical protein
MAIGLLGWACLAIAGDEASTIDLDAWHARSGAGEAHDDADGSRFILGLCPGVGGVLGAPNLLSYQGHIYLSLGRSSGDGVFIGYGEERGSPAGAEIFTLGWGGIRDLPVATRQRGFYGKFVRYRRWDHDDHGIHHGLSFGSEHGVGNLSLSFEVGAARSDRNRWLGTAQVTIKLVLPIAIPLGGGGSEKSRGSGHG